jgi:hypothetical protein
VALIAALALVAVPGVIGSGVHPGSVLDSDLFQPIEVASLVRGSATTITVPDPELRSDGALEPSSALLEPATLPEASGRPRAIQPEASPGSILRNPWRYDSNASFYGPGFYGKRTACGIAYTTSTMGVAHQSLPCGTMIQFRYAGQTIKVPVIDRGPYVPGRTWDLSGAACQALGHCWTGPLEWRYG